MQHADLSRLLARELATLRDELLAYADERFIWAQPNGVPNSAGTLALHMAGNLRWFIGSQLGATGHVRNREEEFTMRDVPRAELIALVERTADEVTRTLATLDESAFDAPYPLPVGGLRVTTSRFLWHLEGHLAYHLGQVDYHRRIVTGNPAPVGALSLVALADR